MSGDTPLKQTLRAIVSSFICLAFAGAFWYALSQEHIPGQLFPFTKFALVGSFIFWSLLFFFVGVFSYSSKSFPSASPLMGLCVTLPVCFIIGGVIAENWTQGRDWIETPAIVQKIPSYIHYGRRGSRQTYYDVEYTYFVNGARFYNITAVKTALPYISDFHSESQGNRHILPGDQIVIKRNPQSVSESFLPTKLFLMVYVFFSVFLLVSFGFIRSALKKPREIGQF